MILLLKLIWSSIKQYYSIAVEKGVGNLSPEQIATLFTVASTSQPYTVSAIYIYMYIIM